MLQAWVTGYRTKKASRIHTVVKEENAQLPKGSRSVPRQKNPAVGVANASGSPIEVSNAHPNASGSPSEVSNAHPNAVAGIAKA